MLIIDRYLLRQFFRAFAICFVSLMGLWMVFDFSTNLEEFLRCSQKAGGLFNLLFKFYGVQSMAFFDRTSGLLALVAVMFTVAQFQRHNEMTALMAAGTSRLRVLRPLIGATLAISLLAVVNRELVIPRFASELSRKPQDLVGDVGQQFDSRNDKHTDVLFRGKATYADCQRIEEPNFLLPPTLSQYGKQLTAKDAYYRPPQSNRPGGYLLDNVQEPKKLENCASLLLDGKPIVIMPRDARDWLQPNQCFVVSDVTFEQLTAGDTFREFASTAQLISGLHNPSLEFGADVKVAIHGRFVKPFLDITVLFLGLPLVSRRETRNVFLAIGLCMAVVTGFSLVVISSQKILGEIYLLPSLGAWFPLMLFIPAAVSLADGLCE
jgi:lipopolysaccharide export system permease protein